MEHTEALRKIRKIKGYSQKSIADILQTTQQQYSKYETGAQEIPIRHIVKLSELYNVSSDSLLGINTYMTEAEAANKFAKFYNEIIDLIYWAEDQDHINYDSATILIENINDIKNDLEREEIDD